MPETESISLLNAIDLGVIILDENKRIIQWNDWMVAASQITRAAAIGKTLGEVFPDATLTRVLSCVRDALESGVSSVITQSLNPKLFPLTRHGGKRLIHNVTIGAVERQKPFRHCIIQILDVTIASEREQLLRKRQNARYDAVVRSAQDVIMTVDARGAIQFANAASAAQLGYTPEELVGKDAGILFKDAKAWNDILSATLDTSSRHLPAELTALRRDGSLSYLEVTASKWVSDSRVYVSAILRDVNERRQIEEALRELNTTLEQRVAERTEQLMQTEEALRQSQKMEAVGQLTGGIAHDFNNLLQGIIGSLDRIKRRIFEGRISEVDKFIDGALASANRAASLTHRLLAFARRQPIDPRPVDVAKLLGSMEELVRRSIGEKLELKITADKDPWLVHCDSNQLENALLNLSINARDASPDGGRLAIDVANVSLTDEQAKKREVPAGDYVRISVTDSGVGMPKDVVDRAFDPFFTTKPIGQGTGLGLSMVYGFVKQANGSIRLESEEGKGTTVEICLPRFRGQADQVVEAATDDDVVPDRNKVVLIVEDESMVRMLTADICTELGYHALEAGNGNSALRILDSGQQIDLLITDIGMPGLNGRQVADAARVKRPKLPILFMTGYAETAISADFLSEGMEILTKPASAKELTGRIRAMMAHK
jgi:PAS domain S-box-containing protein